MDSSYEPSMPSPLPRPLSVLRVPVMPFESYSRAVECVEQTIRSRRKSFWAVINPQKVYRATHDEKLFGILNSADVGICDGVGVAIASKVLHNRFLPRCTGCDLFFRLLAVSARKAWRVFLLGASPESNEGACRSLRKKYPGVQIVGRQHGYFEDSSKVVEQVNASKAELLFVAMGSPKQEYWISEHREGIDAPFCMGVGGSFDVASGTTKRAPKIFQRTGTEFLFQLMMQPRRLRRQAVYLPYAVKVIKEKIFGPTVAPEARGPARNKKAST